MLNSNMKQKLNQIHFFISNIKDTFNCKHVIYMKRVNVNLICSIVLIVNQIHPNVHSYQTLNTLSLANNTIAAVVNHHHCCHLQPPSSLTLITIPIDNTTVTTTFSFYTWHHLLLLSSSINFFHGSHI